MSMYRQMWLAIVVSMLLALAGGLLASTLSARDYLSEQLTMKNTDNVLALALALSQQPPDAVRAKLALAALFDSGHYQLIRLTDPDGRLLVEHAAPAAADGAPEWFMRHFPIVARPGQAQISSGWQQVGTVTLLSHSRFAYQALWQSSLGMLVALGFAGLAGGYLGSFALRRLRQPLNAVIEQAIAITERRFVTIAEPDVPELHQLAAAMNTTVARLKTMFDEEAGRLDALRREAYCDPLTGLPNRTFFRSRFHQSCRGEDAARGMLVLVRIADLAEINRQLGREAGDTLVRAVSAALAGIAETLPDALAARLNGADFALLIPADEGGAQTVDDLLPALATAAAPYALRQMGVFVGYGCFRNGEAPGAVLASVDAALAAAESEASGAAREAATGRGEAPRSHEEWARVFDEALSAQRFRLADFPVLDFAGRLVHRERPLRIQFAAAGEWRPAASFVPMAERLGRTAAFDLVAIDLALESLSRSAAGIRMAVNVSAASLQDPDFADRLGARLAQDSGLAARLALEFSEGGVFHRFDAFRALCARLHGSGCELGIEHFGHRVAQIGRLHDLGLAYLKVDSSFVRGLDASPGNRAYLRGLVGIAHGLGMRVHAEGAERDAEVDALAAAGFDGVTGPAIRERC